MCKVNDRLGQGGVDPTEFRSVDDALRDSQAQLTAIIASAMDAIITVDEQQTIVLFNRAAEKMFGCAAGDAMGSSLARFIPPAYREQHPGHIRQFAETGVTNRAMGQLGALSGLRLNHEEFPIEASISQIEIEGKKLFTVILRDITERTQTEQVLREQAQVLDLSQVMERDLAGRITLWTQACERLYGYMRAEAEGKISHELLSTVFPAPLASIEQELLRNLRWEGELVHRKKGGGNVVVASVWILRRNTRGKPIRVVEANTDITERKQAEEARERLAAVVESSDDAIVGKSLNGTITTWNRGAEKIFGYSREEAVGQPVRMLFPPDREGEEADILSRIARGESIEHYETVRVRKDGRPIHVSVTVSPIKIGTGEIIGASKVARDITERKHTEERLIGQARQLSEQAKQLERSRQKLEAQAALLQSVLNNMAEGLVAADEQGRFTIWNPAAEKIVGLGAATIPHSEWSSHYGLYMGDKVTPFPPDENPLARAIRGEASTAEIFVRNSSLPDGAWIEAYARPLINSDGSRKGGVVAFRDISRRVLADQEIRNLNLYLERRVAERTAELEEANNELEAFTYSVSHDLRAPLRHIAGFSGLLNEEYGDKLEPQAQHYLQRIANGTHKMGLLVDELLTLARVGRQTLNLQVADLDSIVAEIVTLLQPEYEGRDIEWKIGTLPSLECDPPLMRQVFQNLISNALKYSRPRPKALIEIGQIKTDSGVTTIFVRDNGVGFSMKYADKLFGVFQRLHRSEDFEGTGVGLATVQRIIHKHGGHIWAEAELEKGATFFFTIGTVPQQSDLARDGAAMGA